MLHIKNISKKFGDVSVLDSITLGLKEPCILGIAGPSGGGKSTLLRVIQALEVPDSGVIECNVRTGFMFQDFQLFPHMTVLENLIYAPRLHQKTEYEEQAKALLKDLGILSKALHYPCQLSGGQRQRVALARSLMMKPDILLCDEPTSGLDVATIDEIETLLKSVHATGITMLIASHDLEFLTNVSDRIILLNHGMIVADKRPDSTENLIPYLKSLY
jgi:polar amino acid transport system ATP-binding protein